MRNSEKITVSKTSFKKKIKSYSISYCENEFISKNLYGEIRLGFKNEERQVLAFRISHLPLSAYTKSIFNLQQQYSNIGGKACKIIEVIETQSNRYTVMQYFPKTFKTEIDEIRKKTKYMETLISNFLQAYATFYYMHVYHGNLSLENICITFDHKVKLMDFRNLNVTFEEGSEKDYEAFKNIMCQILERLSVFPAKLQSFDQKEGNWVKLFSAWHVVTPYQFLYVKKKKPYQNMTVLIHKIEATLFEFSFQDKETLLNVLKVAFRLLMYSHLKRSKDKKALPELKKLKQILHPMHEHNQCYYNSIIWGIMKDTEYYHLKQRQRLALIVAMIEELNHEYFYMELIKEFDERFDDGRTYKLLADNLLFHYEDIIKSNLIDLS